MFNNNIKSHKAVIGGCQTKGQVTNAQSNVSCISFTEKEHSRTTLAPPEQNCCNSFQKDKGTSKTWHHSLPCQMQPRMPYREAAPPGSRWWDCCQHSCLKTVTLSSHNRGAEWRKENADKEANRQRFPLCVLLHEQQGQEQGSLPETLQPDASWIYHKLSF